VRLQKAVNRAIRASHTGAQLPDGLTSMGNIQSIPALLDRASKAIGLIADNAATLAKVGPDVQILLEDGKKLYKTLEQADVTQEQTRASQLPAAVATFNINKAKL